MSNNWWANKLGQQSRPANLPPLPPSQQPMTPYIPPSNGNPRMPQSATATSQCPGCYGNNYLKIGEQVTMNGAVPTYRCYDCGYPLIQAGSGMGGATSAPKSGGVTPAKQVETGGYNPNTIIGKVE